MNYSVSYQAKQTQEGIPYVENVELCGCETSNPKDYDRLCGQSSVVKQINSVPKDQEVKIVNETKTYFAAGGVTLGLLFLLLLALSAN